MRSPHLAYHRCVYYDGQMTTHADLVTTPDGKFTTHDDTFTTYHVSSLLHMMTCLLLITSVLPRMTSLLHMVSRQLVIKRTRETGAHGHARAVCPPPLGPVRTRICSKRVNGPLHYRLNRQITTDSKD